MSRKRGFGPSRWRSCSWTSTTRTVNDSLGHTEGDRVPVAVATASLRPAHRRHDRAHGRRRVLVLIGCNRYRRTAGCGVRIMGALQPPLEHDGNDITFARHRSQCGTLATTAEDLIRNADMSMYTAKANGRTRSRCSSRACTRRHSLDLRSRATSSMRWSEASSSPVPAHRPSGGRPHHQC